MPEIFYRESTSFVILKTFYWESTSLNNLDPGLKIAGVTRRGESKGFETRGPLIEPFRGDDKGETFRGRLKTARKSLG